MPLLLPNGCHIGKLSVHPLDWDQPTADISIEWYIHYRFHDPRFKGRWPKGYPVKVRNMNTSKILVQRQRITKSLLANENHNLLRGFNPLPVQDSELEISPTTGLEGALKKVFPLVPDSATKKKMVNALPHLQLAITQLRYAELPVSEIEQHHLEKVLIKVGRNKELEYDRLRALPESKKKAIPTQWGAEAFNSYRAYLQILFKQLKKLGATKVKPVDDIEKKTGIKKLRIGFTTEEFDRICDHLKPDYYSFWRLIHLFFPLGARETEFMGIKKEHVNLVTSKVLVLTKKGKGPWEWVWKTIRQKELWLWQEVMAEGSAGHYLFSEGLRPGPVLISARQLTIRWRKHVKKKLGVQQDFYELKHSFTTKVVSMALQKIDQASSEAAAVNSHKGTEMVKRKYDLEAGERLHRELKDSTAGLS
ncbi:MAG TPA: hypothetical protein VFE32_17540 [Puia sp.]|jgi:site-specific recombinase XerC|nr:hypothetical protein [Puia sp.]